MSITSLSPTTATGTPATGSKNMATDAASMQDRFLKLLVAQMNNQDPLNPMDNAQMTTQMAQINTVSGIQQLNETMKGMAQQFTSLQVLQGAAMVGHNVLTAGNKLVPDGGLARGAVDLHGAADSLKVEILSAGGQVVGTVNLGAQQAGRVPFEWDASQYSGTSATYRIVAMRGDQPVPASALVSNKVISVGQDNGTLSLQLRGLGTVAYGDIKAIQ